MLDEATRLVCDLLDADGAWVFTLDAEGSFILAAGHRIPEALAADDCAELRWEPCMCQLAARGGGSDAINVEQCERFARLGGDDGASLYHGSVTLRAGERLLGILNVAFDDRRPLDGDDLNLLSIVGATLSIALRRADLLGRALTDEQAAVEALAAGERRMRSLVQNASEAIMICGADGTPFYISPASERVIGRTPESILGPDGLFDPQLHPDDVERAAAAFNEVVEGGGRSTTLEYRARDGDGAWRNLECVMTNLLDDRDVEGIVVNIRDVTERVRFVQELARRTFFDALTGLPNRTQFLDRLEFAIGRAARSDKTLAVLLVDIDRFNVVNDSIGHAAGDDLLRDVATRLRNVVPAEATIARIGGDEFAALCEECPDDLSAIAHGERLLGALAEPFCVAGRDLVVSSSVGVVTATRPYPSAEELLRDADLALNRAKQTGRGQIIAFDSAMRARTVARMEGEHALRRAIERGELRVLYQPEIDLLTGAVVGMEALVAWQHPERGLVNAGEFIELAEETGLVVPISEWVLAEACSQAKAWRDADPDGALVPVSVNVSTRQIDRTDLPEVVAGAIASTGVDPAGLWIEITESAVMADPAHAIAILEELRDLGVTLAIDDFGTGYSSFAYLRQMPVGVLKIDRSFVAALGRDPADTAVVAAIAELGRALGLTVVAEGVEEREQLDEVVALGCHLGQGYHWSRPLLAADFEAWRSAWTASLVPAAAVMTETSEQDGVTG